MQEYINNNQTARDHIKAAIIALNELKVKRVNHV